MKLNLIILSLFVSIFSFAQIIPVPFIANNNAYPSTISANASYDLTPNNKNFVQPIGYPNPNLLSDFTFSFNQNTPYSIQFIVKGKSYTKKWQFYDQVANFGIFMAFAPDANLEIDYSNTFINYTISSENISRNNQSTFNGNYTIMPHKFGDTYQITSTYDGSNFKVYNNGALFETIAKPTNATWQTAPLHLVLGNNIGYAPVVLDEVRFWNKALTTNEILKTWNKTLTGKEEGLKVYYNFDDQGYPNDNNTSINNINDKTSNNYNATINGCDRNGSAQNFIDEILPSIKSNDSCVISLDANNLDSYPGNGHGFNGNNSKNAYLWHDPRSISNMIFYNSSSYNMNAAPILSADGGRSLLIKNIYGKTNRNIGIDGDWPVTIEAWIKLNTLDNISVASIGENYDGNQFEMAVINNKLNLNLGGNNQLSNTSTLITNKWYHMVCTYDNWQYNIFINGIKERTGWYVGPPPYSTITENDVLVPQNIVNTPLYIGTSQRPFNGKIGILNVYNRALSSAEVLNKFNATKSRFGY